MLKYEDANYTEMYGIGVNGVSVNNQKTLTSLANISTTDVSIIYMILETHQYQQLELLLEDMKLVDFH